ncbi:MAG: tetratricopeptide repeat protein [Candidatus Moduliflexus flocculans]|nr:tetratricopeptide repeat protein [Candidatus Moduliflexus flocculans]
MALDEQMTARLHMEKIGQDRSRPTSPGTSSWPRSTPSSGITRRGRRCLPQGHRARSVPGRTRSTGWARSCMKQTQYKDAAEALEKAVALGYAGHGGPVRPRLGLRGPAGLGQGRGGLREVHRAGPGRGLDRLPQAGHLPDESRRVRRGRRRPARGPEGPAEGPQGPRGPGRSLRQGRPDRERRGRLRRHGRAQSARGQDLLPAVLPDGRSPRTSTTGPSSRSRRSSSSIPRTRRTSTTSGMTYFKLQQYDEAVAAFQQSLAIKPDFEYAWYQIGSSYFSAKKFKEAAEAYKKYVEIKPDDASGWMSIGVSYIQAKNFEAALEPLKKCVELKPNDSVALANLAIAYINLKDNFSAKEIYNKLADPRPRPGGEAEEVHPVDASGRGRPARSKEGRWRNWQTR